jgi:NAD(P)-dependent dehydrogenase (short-subunit alcohol dehydrogenase family)
MDLRDGVALVTGGGSGIGQATARRLAAEGMRVCVVDVNGDAAKAVAAEIDGLSVVADVTDSAQVDAAFAACVAGFGGVDLAHLNAGVSGPPDIGTVTDEEYRRITGINVDGVVFGARAAVRSMRERRDGRQGGAVVATASMAGIEPFPNGPFYTLTKFAVVGLIRAIAPVLVKEGITAHAICPGLVDTPILPDEAKAHFTGLGVTLARPEQVADAVVRAATAGPELTGTCWAVHPDGTVALEFPDYPGPHQIVMQVR